MLSLGSLVINKGIAGQRIALQSLDIVSIASGGGSIAVQLLVNDAGLGMGTEMSCRS